MGCTSANDTFLVISEDMFVMLLGRGGIWKIWSECHNDDVLMTFQSPPPPPPSWFTFWHVSDSPGKFLHETDWRVEAGEIVTLGWRTM